MYCKKEFYDYLSNKHRFCSRNCADLSQRKRVKIRCKRCNKGFEVNRARGRNAKYCSIKCHNLDARKRGKLTPLEWQREIRLKRKIETIIRLGSKCEKCEFDRPLALEVHHDKKRKEHLLCSNCHLELHQREMITFNLDEFLGHFSCKEAVKD